jgi:hypothetical protein
MEPSLGILITFINRIMTLPLPPSGYISLCKATRRNFCAKHFLVFRLCITSIRVRGDGDAPEIDMHEYMKLDEKMKNSHSGRYEEICLLEYNAM